MLRNRRFHAVAFLLSLTAGTWERGTAPGSVGVCPSCPCLSCGPWFFWLWEQGWAGSCLSAVCGTGVVRPGLAHGARLDAAVPLLPCLFLSLHPKGFPTTSQKCLIGHRICPVLFCLVTLAWQAGELGCRRLSRGAGIGRCRWDRPGSRCRLARRRRRRGMAGTPRSGTHGRLASSRSGTPGWPCSLGPGFLTFSFSTAELAGVDRSPTGDVQRPERG